MNELACGLNKLGDKVEILSLGSNKDFNTNNGIVIITSNINLQKTIKSFNLENKTQFFVNNQNII